MEVINDRIEEKKFSELLSDGFKLFSRNYKLLLFIWLVFNLIYDVLFVFLLTDIRYLYYNKEISRMLYLIFFYIISGLLGILRVIQVCLVSTYLFKKYINLKVDFKEEFNRAINYRLKYPIFIYLLLFIIFDVIFDLFWDYLSTSLFISGVGVICITILSQIISIPFILLSLIATALYIFTIYTYKIENIERPIHEARSLTKGSFWKIVAVLIINLIIQGIVLSIYYLLSQYIILSLFRDFYKVVEAINYAIRNYGLVLLYHLIFGIPTILLGSLEVCLITPFFSNQYLKKVNNNQKSF